MNVQMVITSGQVYSWADDVDKVLNFTDELLKYGGYVFPEVAAVAEIVSKVGGFIRWVTGNWKEEKPDAIKKVIAKLALLEKKIDELEMKIKAEFDDLKEFLTEINFLTNITVPTSSLMRFMQDIMNDPSPSALANFQRAYADRKPLMITYDLLGFLEHEKTNPLRMAISADPLRTITTFNRWTENLTSILGQLLFLESMASGLMKDYDTFDADLIIQRAQELTKQIDEWREVYKKDGAYFGGMESYLSGFLTNNSNFQRWEIAQKMKEDLEKKLLTNDALSVWVFAGSVSKGMFAADCSDNAKGQVAYVMDKNGFGAVICRSSQANLVEKEKLRELERQMFQFSCSPFFPQVDYKEIPKLVLRDYFPDGGSFCLINSNNVPEMRSINCKHDVGPGVLGQITTVKIPYVNQRTFSLMAVYI
ncbi:hypothetical protein GCK72_021707 [Caenorhabditis remanei]|uniref:Uncharacterized protein n=1 Tax=Caenorhabditis remanei TaxID=31234 RepID=A0A6A5GIW5_CAERE|nr:hypothetical protein GCK72_021707 [Caenorhabditis remanei]KAF1755138.1 hypothetical protein GCK72_021707 [Caenorhabditis remanei]